MPKKWLDYYKILELEYPSNEIDIKKSYRRLSKIYHPDSKTGNKEYFIQIGEAYEILSNPIEKNKYDKSYNVIKQKFNTSQKEQTLKDLIMNTKTLEGLANIWKNITNNIQEKDELIELIIEQLNISEFINPYFYKEPLHEQYNAEELIHLRIYIIKCITEKYKLTDLDDTIDLNKFTQINKEQYYNDLIRYTLKTLENYIITYKIENKHLINDFYNTILVFDYFVYQTDIQDELFFIAQILPNPQNAVLKFLLASYKRKLLNIKKIITSEEINFYEEALDAKEKNSPLHYSIAYFSLTFLYHQDLNNPYFKKNKKLLQKIKNDLRKSPFNLYEFTLLNRSLNFSLDNNTYNIIVYALATSLDNENLHFNIDIYHQKFYENLVCINVEQLSDDTKEEIRKLAAIYCSFYSQVTFRALNTIEEDLKKSR